MNKPKALNLAPIAYLTYAEVNGGRPSTREEFRRHLAQFGRESLLLFCAYANTVLFGANVSWNWDDHDALAKRFLDARLLEMRSTVQDLRPPILHREMLLFLIKEAAAVCPSDGLDCWSGPSWNLAKAVLMANEQLGFPAAKKIPHENNLALLANIVTASEGSRFSSWRHKMVRTALMLTYVLEKRPELLKQFDVFELFRNVTGIQLRTFLSMIFAVATKHLTEKQREGQLPDLYQIDDQWFRNTIVSAPVIAAFLADVSATPDQLTAGIKASNTHVSDFRGISSTPIINFSNQYVPIGFDFLMDKAYSGVFWKVLGALRDRKEQDRFISFWGSVFEEYVNWVLEGSIDPSVNQFIRDPRYCDEPGAQVCDGIIISGNVACFLEYKGSMFKAEAKYTGDPHELKKEIDLKLIGKEDNRKGLLQLSKAIAEVGGAKKRQIEGVDSSLITKIYPVLIVRDEIALAFCFNEYLDFRFRQICSRQRGKTITPLFVLGIDDLERIANYLDKIPLHKILRARWKADPQLAAPFFTVKNSLMPEAPHRAPKVIIQGLDLVSQMTKEIMFGVRE